MENVKENNWWPDPKDRPWERNLLPIELLKKINRADGGFKFTPGKWKHIVDKYGNEHNFNMRDINDPKKQKEAALHLLLENEDKMFKMTKKNTTPLDAYIAHYLGPEGALKLIKNKDSNKPANKLFPDHIVRDNRSIFFDKTKPRTAAEVYSFMDSKVS